MRTLIYLLTVAISMFSPNLINAQPFFINEEHVTIPDSTEAKMKYLGFQEDYLRNDDGSWSKVILVETDRITLPTGVSLTKEEVEKLYKGEEVVKSEKKGVFLKWSFQLPLIEGFNVDTKTGYTLIGKSFLAKKYPDSVRQKDLPFWMIPVALMIVILMIFRKLSFRELSWAFVIIILTYWVGGVSPAAHIITLCIVCALLMFAGILSEIISLTLTPPVVAVMVIMSRNTKDGQVEAGVILSLFLAVLLVIKWRKERKQFLEHIRRGSP